MDAKYVRSAVDRLLADLEKDPRIGRPSLMARFGRPIGFGVALGLGGLTGCGSDPSLPVSGDAADTVVAPADVPADLKDVADTRDVLPRLVDAYGLVAPDVPPPWPEVADVIPPSGPEVADVIPPSGDLYGLLNPDTRDVLPPPGDAYGIISRDTRDVLPPSVDVYGADRPPAVDASDVLPPSVDVYAMTGDAGVIDGGALDADKTG
jgi:hypothetical protein